ncbi:MAG: tripartite ATP-independent periplasmic transporter, DctQ component [Devosia sp.]|nr:tripartite ATP-independent periplasmic transporter, DctQ component [Devosia sp.]
MLTRINNRLLAGATVVTWVFTGLLVALVTVNVVARYIFGVGILWAEEASRLLFVWAVFLGAYIALTRGGHMALEVVVRAMAPGLRRYVVMISWVLVVAFLVVLVVAGSGLVGTTMRFGRTTPILGISAAWTYLAVPAAALLMTLSAMEQAIRSWRSPSISLPAPSATTEVGL